MKETRSVLAKAVSQATLTPMRLIQNEKGRGGTTAGPGRQKDDPGAFAGRLGICSLSSGQYLNVGDKIVTLQALESLYVDFFLPQQELSRITLGQTVVASTDAFPDQKFRGRITAISSKVEAQTRNVQIEAVIDNPQQKLLPGMYVKIQVQAGDAGHYLTIPRTAVAFNPYGETVYVVERGQDVNGQSIQTVKQQFVTVVLLGEIR